MKPVNVNQCQKNLLITHESKVENYQEHFIKVWEAWAGNAEPSCGEERDVALSRLKEALLTDSMELNLSQLSLTALPDCLPPVVMCDFSRNRLTILPVNLPRSVQVLKVDHNQLETLPKNLPNSLTFLNASNNQLTSLPPQLPDSLKTLIVIRNQLTDLPDNLPNSISLLQIDHNQLVNLPATLPNSLRCLTVNHNQLIYLPNNLPDSITCLEMNDNLLSNLPNTLPSCLTQLSVCQNQLTSLPTNFPVSMQVIDASSNRLTTLPDTLPPDLNHLNLSTNNIMLIPFFINRLSMIYPRARIQLGNQMSGDLIDISFLENDFIEKLQLWDTNLTLHDWKEIKKEENAEMFAEFIEKLHQGQNRINQQLKSKVIEFLNYLKKEENSEIRQQVFLLSHEASASCVDKASYYFNQMHLLMVEDNLTKTAHSDKIADLFWIIQRIYRMRELDKIAAGHAERLRETSPGFNEDIELHSIYQVKLRDELCLPMHTTVQYDSIARISEADLVTAKENLLHQEKNYFIPYLVIESRSWKKKIEAWNSQKKQQATNDYLETIDSNTFQELIDNELRHIGLPTDDLDRRREIGKGLVSNLLYRKYFELTYTFLEAHNALTLLDNFFNLPH